MRVLFIHNQYQQPGGEDVAVSMEAELLREKGHEVRTVIFQNTDASGGIDQLDMARRAIYNPASYRRVWNEIKDFGPEIIHVHNLFFVASPALLYAAKKLNVPVILTLHNFRLICANALLLRNGHACELCVHQTLPISGIRYKCYRNSMAASALVTAITGIHKILGTWNKKINRFILLTEFSKSRFVNSSLKVPEKKLVVKPNFVPDPGVGMQDREDFFLFAGRLSPEKGINILLQAFADLPQQRLVVIGEGPELESATARFMKTSNIIFKGRLEKDEVMSYMKRCAALIFPSTWYEGLPFVIIEAFATGTPVITSRLGSMAELIENGVNGFHFEAGNVRDLQQKINLYLQIGAEERRMLHTKARAAYLNHYQPGIHYQTILQIYEDVIAEK